jgi:hypothetical protein
MDENACMLLELHTGIEVLLDRIGACNIHVPLACLLAETVARACLSRFETRKI